MSLNETPGANRIHIGFYGKRNSGKSSLINAFTGQQVAIVSDVAGTTTDPVYKRWRCTVSVRVYLLTRREWMM